MKRISTKKLSLDTQTVRALASGDLAHAAGGALNPTHSCVGCSASCNPSGTTSGSASAGFDCHTRNFCFP